MPTKVLTETNLSEPEAMPLDVQALCAHWETTPPVPRVLCGCARAYIVDDTSGRPCDECYDEAMREAALSACPECGGDGWVWHPDAICFASELDARIACSACTGPCYD